MSPYRLEFEYQRLRGLCIQYSCGMSYQVKKQYSSPAAVRALGFATSSSRARLALYRRAKVNHTSRVTTLFIDPSKATVRFRHRVVAHPPRPRRPPSQPLPRGLQARAAERQGLARRRHPERAVCGRAQGLAAVMSRAGCKGAVR